MEYGSKPHPVKGVNPGKRLAFGRRMKARRKKMPNSAPQGFERAIEARLGKAKGMLHSPGTPSTRRAQPMASGRTVLMPKSTSGTRSIPRPVTGTPSSKTVPPRFQMAAQRRLSRTAGK